MIHNIEWLHDVEWLECGSPTHAVLVMSLHSPRAWSPYHGYAGQVRVWPLVRFLMCVCVRVEQDLPIKALTTNKVDRTQVNQNLDRTPSYSPSPTAGMTCGVGKFKICNYTFYVYRL